MSSSKSHHSDREDRQRSSGRKHKTKQTAFFEMSSKPKDEEEEVEYSSEEDQEIRTEKVAVDDTERLKDIEERDEFAERLKARDEANTKRKTDQSSNKMLEEAAKRLKLEKEDRSKVMPSLREQSRQQYLERREQDKLAELEDEVLDEEFLFQNVELTEYEKKRIEQKKKTLEIARQYKEADKLEKVDRYYIPDDKVRYIFKLELEFGIFKIDRKNFHIHTFTKFLYSKPIIYLLL
jgi:pre-mRNA-splicing factor ATP-dependent RNA helicase DHX16